MSGNILSPTAHLPQLPDRRDWPIGCIGAGFIMNDCHLVAYRKAGFNPVAIASRNPQTLAQVAERHGIRRRYAHYRELLRDREIQVLDIAVPPHVQIEVIREAVKENGHIRAILAQKPLGINFQQAREMVRLCEDARILLAVNQNMRYDQSVRACKALLLQGALGRPVFASIDMRAIPHWMPWQAQLGWATIRTMSIHHLDCFRYWFGDPQFVYASVCPDPRTARSFAHEDGVSLYILEYGEGLRASAWDDVWTGPAREGAAADHGIRWRVEGERGTARGTIGWPEYPRRTPSTLDYTTVTEASWISPRWEEVWFPDAFAGPMAQLLCALESGTEPEISGRDNLHTMALVDACYVSIREHRPVSPEEMLKS